MGRVMQMFVFQFSDRRSFDMVTEKEFALIPEETREVLRTAIAEAIGEPDAKKIGDGKLKELLAKLLPLLIQFAPLFFGVEKEEIDRKIGDGTIATLFVNALSNPQFIQSIAGLIAMIQGLFPAKK
jgi:hypothetical protein